jgi:hypothetical protein
MAEPGKTTAGSRPYSGTSETGDPTNEPGQYPPGSWGDAIFGGQLPSGTGAPGSAGGHAALDPTTEQGQLEDGFTGLTTDEITQTGAPGTQGAVDHTGGGDAITYTTPTDGIGPYQMTSTTDDVTGPGDWTGANDQGYATGGPQLPGIKGNEPQAGQGRFQPGGSGKVMRGGRAVSG